MSTAISIISILIGVAIGFTTLEFLYGLYNNLRAKKKSTKEIECNCRVYHNKARGYYYLKERDARGKLVYMKGSYSYTEQEAREFCSNN